MKPQVSIGRSIGIVCLVLLFAVAGTGGFCTQAAPVKKEQTAAKKPAEQSVPVLKKADLAVVPVFAVKLYQQVFVTFERKFHVLSSERPRHPNTYPVYRSAFFANIFSKAIAINAP